MLKIEADDLKNASLISNEPDAPECEWGPLGIVFAQFHLAGDLDVFIHGEVPGIKDIQMRVTIGTDHGPGNDTRVHTVLRMSKSRARAIASAIMGAAAEL